MERRERIITYCLLGFLLTSLSGLQFIHGNFSIIPGPSYPVKEKPSITIITPDNGTATGKETDVCFNIAMPQSWIFEGKPWGAILGVTYTLNGKEIYWNYTKYGYTSNSANQNATSINYTKNCKLIVGTNRLTIYVSAITRYYGPFSGKWAPIYDYDVSNSENFTFEVNTLDITNLSLENRTYTNSILPLTFCINGTSSWISYSLDNQANQTIAGNSTLTGLGEGDHSLVVYANDTFGNMGKSDTVYFNIELPTPTPSPIPSPTMVITPTLEPTSTIISNDNFGITYLIPILAVIIIAIVGLAIVFRKRRK
jgi:hypothetical protein